MAKPPFIELIPGVVFEDIDFKLECLPKDENTFTIRTTKAVLDGKEEIREMSIRATVKDFSAAVIAILREFNKLRY